MIEEGLIDENGVKFKAAILNNISERKYHQVKRMMHLVGVVVTYLKRLKIENIVLPEGLEVGSYIEISQNDIYKLTNFDYNKKGF